MLYKWVDYHKGYKEVVETWLDDEAVKYTGCAEGWDQYFEYWKNEPGTVLNGNFFSKVVLDGGKAVGVIAVYEEKNIYYIQEFVVSPDRRCMGTGSSILKELLQSGEYIVGKTITRAEACIFPSNISSRKAFEKAGFRYSRTHPDGDTCYYEFRKED